ncbi:MAG: hypothetical protein FJ279_06735 [Planctomycetes bacterium]|nr:hypothetical protein [Planctomycetota bacterium]
MAWREDLMLRAKDIRSLSREEKLKFLHEIEDSGEWRGDYEEIYVALFDDPDPEVRQFAVAAFWDFPEEKYVDRLIKKARGDADAQVRAEASSVLGIYIYEGFVIEEFSQTQAQKVRRFLLDTVENEKEDPLVRRRALEAVSFDDSEEIFQHIDMAYASGDTDWRATAIFCMGRCGNERYSPTILKELDSRDKLHKLEAIGAAGEAFLATATPKLRVLAMDRDKDVRLEAIWALSHTAGPGALESLELCAVSSDEDVQRVAQEAIEEYRAFYTEEGEEEGDEEDEEA